MLDRDYVNYDYIMVSVKEDKYDPIIRCYEKLGWERVQSNEDAVYYNLVTVIFRRPHKVMKKDRLQLLQVWMETQINDIASASKGKHTFSIVSGLVLYFIYVAFVVSGCLVATLCSGAILFWVGLSIAALGILLAAISVYPLCRRVRKENAVYEARVRTASNELENYMQEADALAYERELYETDLLNAQNEQFEKQLNQSVDGTDDEADEVVDENKENAVEGEKEKYDGGENLSDDIVQEENANSEDDANADIASEEKDDTINGEHVVIENEVEEFNQYCEKSESDSLSGKEQRDVELEESGESTALDDTCEETCGNDALDDGTETTETEESEVEIVVGDCISFDADNEYYDGEEYIEEERLEEDFNIESESCDDCIMEITAESVNGESGEENQVEEGQIVEVFDQCVNSGEILEESVAEDESDGK